MNLNNFKLLHEDENHYHLQAPKGKPFKVEKVKLDKKAHHVIKGLQKFEDGGPVEPANFDQQEQQQIQEAKQKPINNAADNEILKSVTNRTDMSNPKDEAKRNVKEQLLNPKHFDDGGMSTIQDQQNITPSSPQTPQQMSSMPLPAGQSTQQDSDQQVQNNLKENDESVEPSAIGPEDIALLGSSALLSNAGRAATEAVGRNLLGNAGKIGVEGAVEEVAPKAASIAEDAAAGVVNKYKSAAKIAEDAVPEEARHLIPMVKDHFNRLFKPLSKLPAELQQKHLQTMYQGYTQAMGDLTPDLAAKFKGIAPEEILDRLGTLEGVSVPKHTIYNELHRDASGVLSNLTQSALKKKADGGMIHRYTDGTDGTVPDDRQSSTARDLVNELTSHIPMNDAPLAAYTQKPSNQVAQPISQPDQVNAPVAPDQLANQMSQSTQYQVVPPSAEPSILQQYMADTQKLGDLQAASMQAQSSAVPPELISDAPLKSIQEHKAVTDDNIRELGAQLGNGKIDPSRMWGEMGTGNKILTAIGMFLHGGLGSTLQSLATGIIPGLADKDIEAQKTDSSTKMNLYKLNRQASSSDQEAMLKTKQQQLEAIRYNIQKQALQSGAPIAQQNAKLAIDGIQREQGMLSYKLALAQGNSNTSPGGYEGTEEANNARVAGLKQAGYAFGDKDMTSMGEELGKRTVPGVGTIPNGPIPQPQETQKLINYKNAIDSLEKAKAFQQSGPGANIGAWSPANIARGNALAGEILSSAAPLLLDIKRYNPDLANNLTAGIKSPGSFDLFGKNAAAIDQLKQFAEENYRNQSQGLGIVPFKKAPLDLQAIQWAKSHLNDPRAQQILKKNNIR